MSIVFGFVLFLLSAMGSLLMARLAIPVSRGSNAIASVLASVTFFFALVIGAFLVAGYFELLTGRAAVTTTSAALVVAVVIAVTLAIARTRGGGGQPTQVTTCILDALMDWGRVIRAASHATPRLVVVLTIMSFGALTASIFVVGFPRGTEASVYHLYNGFTALQTRSLRIPDSFFLSAIPANAGLWYAYLASYLPERFTALAQMPFLPVLALAVYAVARRAGADSRAAVFAAIGLLTMPVITLEAENAEADVFGLMLLAIALYFVLATELSKVRFVIAGIGIGLAFGVKSLYLIGGGLIFFATVALSTWLPGPRRWYRDASIVAAAAFAMGGFWLVRNYMQTGNPLYPIHVQSVFDLLGWPAAKDVDVISPGTPEYMWVHSVAEWPLYPWTEWHAADAGTHYKPNAGFGAFFATVVPVAWLYCAADGLIRLKRGSWDTTACVRLVLLLSGSGMLIAWFLLGVGARQPRYASAAWIFLLPLTGATICALQGRARTIVEGLLAVCILWMLFAFITQELATFGDRVLYSRQRTSAQYYEYPATVDKLPAGSKVLNLDARNSNFPLMGSEYRNRVIRFVIAVRVFGIEAKQTGWDASIDNDTKGVHLTAHEMQRLGVSHVYMRPTPRISHDDCVQLQELDRVDRNPISNARIDPPKVLYAVRYCDAPTRYPAAAPLSTATQPIH